MIFRRRAKVSAKGGVDGEFYYLDQAIQNNYWDPSLPGSANSVLSIVILGTVFSEGLGLSTSSVLKTVYPLIFAIVPTILYAAYRREFSSKLSLFAALFFMFNLYFFTEALLLRRQQIALIFVALLLLLLTEKRIYPRQRSILYLIFTISLVISHYSVSANWILIVILASSIYFIKKVYDAQTTSNPSQQNESSKRFILSDQNISSYHIIFPIVIFIVWYIYTSFSTFSGIVGAGHSIIENFALFADTSAKSSTISVAMGAGFWEVPSYTKLYRLLQYAFQGFIIIGLISNIFSQGLKKLNVCFRTAAMTFLIASMILPFMSIFQNMSRLYFFTLFFLSPCCIVGAYQAYCWSCQVCRSILKHMSQSIEAQSTNENSSRKSIPSSENRAFYTLLTIICLVPFFFLTSGLVFDIGGFNEDTRVFAQIPGSNILSYGRIYPEYHDIGEVTLGSKLPRFLSHDDQIYADISTGLALVSAWHGKSNYVSHGHRIPENSYLFMRSWDIDHHVIRGPVDITRPFGKIDAIDISSLSSNKDCIYANGHAELYRIR